LSVKIVSDGKSGKKLLSRICQGRAGRNGSSGAAGSVADDMVAGN
jgi:hypothetical protein